MNPAGTSQSCFGPLCCTYNDSKSNMVRIDPTSLFWKLRDDSPNAMIRGDVTIMYPDVYTFKVNLNRLYRACQSPPNLWLLSGVASDQKKHDTSFLRRPYPHTQWIDLREKLQENPIYFVGFFPEINPLCEIYRDQYFVGTSMVSCRLCLKPIHRHRPWDFRLCQVFGLATCRRQGEQTRAWLKCTLDDIKSDWPYDIHVYILFSFIKIIYYLFIYIYMYTCGICVDIENAMKSILGTENSSNVIIETDFRQSRVWKQHFQCQHECLWSQKRDTSWKMTSYLKCVVLSLFFGGLWRV